LVTGKQFRARTARSNGLSGKIGDADCVLKTGRLTDDLA
jgi:hypothetical protein